jgi:hypothetical protein
VYAVSAFGVAIDLLRRLKDESILRDSERLVDELARKGDIAAGLQLGLVLAENGNSKACELACKSLTSRNTYLVSDAVQVIQLAGTADQFLPLQQVYPTLPDGCAAKEFVLTALNRLDAQAAARFMLGALPNEKEKSRRREMMIMLRATGMDDQGIASSLASRSIRPDGHLDVNIASTLLEMGDSRLLSKLRSEVSQVGNTNTSESLAYVKSVVQVLGRARDAQAVDALGRLLQQSGDASVRSEAHKALAAIGTPEAMMWIKLSQKP